MLTLGATSLPGWLFQGKLSLTQTVTPKGNNFYTSKSNFTA